MPSKTSSVDFIPTSLIKLCPLVFSEIIATLANLSFSQGIFPAKFKEASVVPLLKKPSLDPDNPANYRLISNLNNISKMLERLFLSRFYPHVTSSPHFNHLQSAYRKFHSTESALLHTFDSIYRSADQNKPTFLVSLDLSAAFDTIDHSILLNRLSTSFGIQGSALAWLTSYLSDRSQTIRIGSAASGPSNCQSGVPQGSVLGPILFSLYISLLGISSPASIFLICSTLMILSSIFLWLLIALGHRLTASRLVYLLCVPSSVPMACVLIQTSPTQSF